MSIAHTLQAWATAMGMADSRTLQSRLVKAGITIKPKGGKYSAKAVYVAMVGDKEAEQVRELKLKNEALELEAAEKKGQLHSKAAIEELIWEKGLSPLREALLNLSKVVAAQCNPKDPETARKVLDAHVAGVMKQLSEALPKTATKEKP